MLKKLAILGSLSMSLTLSSAAHAGSEIGFSSTKALKNAAVMSFLAQANDKKSELGKFLEEINEASKDGRNHDGTIALPVKASALQIMVLEAEQMLAPWHYAERVGGVCKGTGDSAKFLIALSSTTGVHSAQAFGALVFQLGAKQVLSTKILANTDSTCDAVVEDKAGDFGAVKTTIEISKITPTVIAPPAP